MKIELCKVTPLQKLVIAKGLCDYQYIMENWQTNDRDFQAVYFDFYLKARRFVMSETNREQYFSELKSITPEYDIMHIVRDLKDRMGKKSYELSIASKLLHTRNPSCPIYDSKIRTYLSKFAEEEERIQFWWQISNKDSGAPRGTSAEQKIAHDWCELCKWYEDFLKSPRGKKWIEWFDINFPTYKSISSIKKVDSIIFATQ